MSDKPEAPSHIFTQGGEIAGSRMFFFDHETGPYSIKYIRADLAKPSEWIRVVSKCITKAESMIGSPTEDDLQKFIDWMRDEFTLPPPPDKEKK